MRSHSSRPALAVCPSFPKVASAHRTRADRRARRRPRAWVVEGLEGRILLAFKPIVTTGAASAFTTAATLSGTVNPDASTTVAGFQYSTDPSFAPSVVSTVGSGFNTPAGVAVDNAGDVFVTDSGDGDVREFLPDGTVKTLASGLNQPFGVAVSTLGRVYVADSGDNVVKEILPDGTIKTFTGFVSPQGVAVDIAGDVFVADAGAGAIKEIIGDNLVQTFATGLNSPSDVDVDGSSNLFVVEATANDVKEIPRSGAVKTIVSGLNTPSEVAVDRSGDVFVTDSGNNAVKEVLPSGTVKTIQLGDDGLSFPAGIAVDGAGDVFIADSDNSRVLEWSIPATTAQAGLTGVTPVGVSETLTGLTPGTTYYYRTVATNDGGTMVDTLPPLHSFKTLDPPSVTTGAASQVSDTHATLSATVNPDGSTTAAGFQYSTDPSFAPTVASTVGTGFTFPESVAVDAAGNVFVADSGHFAVKEVLRDGTIKTIVTGSGLGFLQSIAVDAADNVYVADTDHSAIKEVLPDGTIKAIGSGFDHPSGVAVDGLGDVFVADTGNNAVKEVFPDGTIATIGSGFFVPADVAVDAAGDVFVADADNNAVKEISPFGAITTIGSGFTLPSGVAVDASGDVFVTDDTNTVFEVLPGGTVLTLGSGFNFPLGMSVDGEGNLFVADGANSRIVELSTPTIAAAPSGLSGSSPKSVSATLTGLAPGTTYYYRAIAANAGGSVADLGTPIHSFITTSTPVVSTGPLAAVNATGATFTATVNPGSLPTTARFQFSTSPSFAPTLSTSLGSGFNRPGGVAVDSAGDVYVADTNHNAIKEILPDGTIRTVGSGWSLPQAVAVDASGDVFVADSGNNLLEEVLPDGTIKALAGGLSSPESVAVDASGDVFVTATFLGLVKEIFPDGTIATVGPELGVTAGVAVDSSGDVFVADSGKNAIVEILPGGVVKKLGSGWRSPTGVAVDSSGDVFVTDTDGLKEILPDGTVELLDSALSQPGNLAVDGAGDVFIAGAGHNQVIELAIPSVAAMPDGLDGPSDVAIYASAAGLLPGTTYYYRVVAANALGTVADTQTPPHSFTTLNPPAVKTGTATPSPSGATLNALVKPNGSATNVAFQYSTDPGFAPTVESIRAIGFGTLAGVAADGAGAVFAVDQHNGLIKEFLPDGTIKIIGSGFSGPTGVALDSSGDLFVGDTGHGAVKEVLPDGTIKTVYQGDGSSAPEGVAVDGNGDVFFTDGGLGGDRGVKEVLPDGTVKRIGNFLLPKGVAVDGTGDLFVADFTMHAIEEILPDGTSRMVGSGLSHADGVAVDSSGDVFVIDAPVDPNNPFATLLKEILPDGTEKVLSPGFAEESGLAVDGAGNLVVSDGSSTVERIRPDGSIAIVASGISRASGVAVDGAGDLIIADSGNNAVKEIFADGTVKSFSGFNSPSGVAVDASGDIFVANSFNNTIKEILPDGTVRTVASGFTTPLGVAVDSLGDVFVADTLDSIIKEILPDGTTQTLDYPPFIPGGVAVDGAGDLFIADTGHGLVEELRADGTRTPIGSGFFLPHSVAVDAAGDVFVADTGNAAVKEVLPDGTIKTLGSGWQTPLGVAVDAAGDIYVTDTGLGEVVEFSPATVAATPAGLVGSSPASVSATLTGLAPDTRYYYRAVARNRDGTVVDTQAPVHSFTTSVQTFFSQLVGGSIAYGATSVALSGQLMSTPSAPFPAGGAVSVSIEGVPQSAPVNADGTFQINYTFSPALGNFPLGVPASPILVTYTFTDPTGAFSPAVFSTRILTITRDTPSVTVADAGGTYDGSPFAASAHVSGVVSGLDGTPSAALEGVTPTLAYYPGTDTTLAQLTGLTPLAGAPSDAGAYTVLASFPGSADYVAASALANFTIAKANATIAVTPYNVTYDGNPHTATGTALGVNGEDLGALLDLGGTTHTGAADDYTDPWAFAGNGNYSSAGASVDDRITRATPAVSVSDAGGTYNGQAFAATASVAGLDGVAGSDLEGVAPIVTYYSGTYTDPSQLAGVTPLADAPISAGAYTALATFPGSSDYAGAAGVAAFTIAQATPGASWTNPSDIVYGTALSATQLDATATVPGQFVYTPAAGTILDAGPGQVLSATFTPLDTTDYVSVDMHVVITVVPATSSFSTVSVPAVTFGDSTDTVTGQIASSAADGAVPTGSVSIVLGTTTSTIPIQPDGRFSASFTTSGLDAGSYTLSYSFGATRDFTAASAATNLVVNKANASLSVTGYCVIYDGKTHTATGTARGVNGEDLGALLNLGATTHTGAGIYSGDAWSFAGNGNYNGAGGSVGDRIAQAQTQTVLTAAPGPSVVGQGVTFTASVSVVAPGGGTPAGSVVFKSGANVLATAPLALVGHLAQASFTTTALPAGTDKVTATYVNADGNLTGSTGDVSQVVLGPGVSVSGTTLYVVGGRTCDVVGIAPLGGRCDGTTGLLVVAVLNGTPIVRSFNQPLTNIVVATYGGNDVIVAVPAIRLPTSVTAADGNDLLTLGDGPNAVTLGDGNDVVYAGDGTNSITAGDGNDTVSLGLGANTVTLGDGNDTVVAGDGNNTISVGDGNDIIRLGRGDNVVVEGGGNDSVTAGDGANLIVGGLGQHTIKLGDGNDILIDGTATLTQPGDSLRKVLSDWKGSAATAVSSRLKVTYNTAHPNALQAGTGRDWFFFSYARDHANRKPTDRLD